MALRAARPAVWIRLRSLRRNPPCPHPGSPPARPREGPVLRAGVIPRERRTSTAGRAGSPSARSPPRPSGCSVPLSLLQQVVGQILGHALGQGVTSTRFLAPPVDGSHGGDGRSDSPSDATGSRDRSGGRRMTCSTTTPWPSPARTPPGGGDEDDLVAHLLELGNCSGGCPGPRGGESRSRSGSACASGRRRTSPTCGTVTWLSSRIMRKSRGSNRAGRGALPRRAPARWRE